MQMLPFLFTCKLLIKPVESWEVSPLHWCPLACLTEIPILLQPQVLNITVTAPTTCFHTGKLRIVTLFCLLLFYHPFISSDVIVQLCLLSDRMLCCDLMLLASFTSLPPACCGTDLVTKGTGPLIHLVNKIQGIIFKTNMCILWEDFYRLLIRQVRILIAYLNLLMT